MHHLFPQVRPPGRSSNRNQQRQAACEHSRASAAGALFSCGTLWRLWQHSIPCTAAPWPGLTALTASLPLPPSSAPQIPHYHLEKATEAVKPVMGEVRRMWLAGGGLFIVLLVAGHVRLCLLGCCKQHWHSAPRLHAPRPNHSTRRYSAPACPAAVLPRARAQPRLVPHPPH